MPMNNLVPAIRLPRLTRSLTLEEASFRKLTELARKTGGSQFPAEALPSGL